jgi:hypothetical protein
MPVGNTPKCLFIVSLGSADLISSTNEVWLSKKLNSANGVSPNLNFGQKKHFSKRKVFGLDGVEDADEETLLFGSLE